MLGQLARKDSRAFPSRADQEGGIWRTDGAKPNNRWLSLENSSEPASLISRARFESKSSLVNTSVMSTHSLFFLSLYKL